jgi:hypothetical protein
VAEPQREPQQQAAAVAQQQRRAGRGGMHKLRSAEFEAGNTNYMYSKYYLSTGTVVCTIEQLCTYTSKANVIPSNNERGDRVNAPSSSSSMNVRAFIFRQGAG